MKNFIYCLLAIIPFLSSCNQTVTSLDVPEVGYGIAKIEMDYIRQLGITLGENDLLLFTSPDESDTLISQYIPSRENPEEIWILPEGHATVHVSVISDLNSPAFEPRTNIRFAPKKPELHEVTTMDRLPGTDTRKTVPEMQFEGPGWENEYVAFRNYFDQRNGMDIFGKKTEEMVLDQVGLPDGPSYHEMGDWGMDILKVGNSLGAGSIALQIGDSLYRIAPGADASAEILTEGPLYSSLKLSFRNWQVAGRTYEVEHVISIQSGTRFYTSEVVVRNLRGDETLVTGIVNMDNHELREWKGEKEIIFGTYAAQGYLGENLGMAIKVPADELVSGSLEIPNEGDGITQTSAISLKLYPDQPTTFQFYACWEHENDQFSDVAGFENFIKQELE